MFCTFWCYILFTANSSISLVLFYANLLWCRRSFENTYSNFYHNLIYITENVLFLNFHSPLLDITVLINSNSVYMFVNNIKTTSPIDNFGHKYLPDIHLTDRLYEVIRSPQKKKKKIASSKYCKNFSSGQTLHCLASHVTL